MWRGRGQAQYVVQHDELMLIASHGGIGIIAMHVRVSQVLHQRLQPSCLPQTPDTTQEVLIAKQVCSLFHWVRYHTWMTCNSDDLWPGDHEGSERYDDNAARTQSQPDLDEPADT